MSQKTQAGVSPAEMRGPKVSLTGKQQIRKSGEVTLQSEGSDPILDPTPTGNEEPSGATVRHHKQKCDMRRDMPGQTRRFPVREGKKPDGIRISAGRRAIPQKSCKKLQGRRPDIPGLNRLNIEMIDGGSEASLGPACNSATPPEATCVDSGSHAQVPLQKGDETIGVVCDETGVTVPGEYIETRYRETGSVDPEMLQPLDRVLGHVTRSGSSETDTPASTLSQQAEAIAKNPDILFTFGEAVHMAGLVGEERNARLLYLALTSRVLNRPVSMAVKGDSSTGKSYTVDSVLKFFPKSAVLCLTSASPKALYYSDDCFSHRFLYLAEAAGMGSHDNQLQTALRILLSEGKLVYKTVVPGGGGTQTITKEGPTGFLTTTTNHKLYYENETRILSLESDESLGQTKAIIASCFDEESRSADLDPWLELQTWIDSAEHRVTLPYGPSLAELMVAAASRMRRDATLIRGLIESHAILHQWSRERTSDGRIVAKIADYAAVYDLVNDLVSAGVEASVDPSVRSAVETLGIILEERGTGSNASVTEVAERLTVDKSTASRNLKKAAAAGYVANLEKGPGRIARFILGDAMPGDSDVLPSPQSVLNHWQRLQEDCGKVPERV